MNRFDDLLGKYDNQVVLFDMISASPRVQSEKEQVSVTMNPCLLISSPMNAFSWVTWL